MASMASMETTPEKKRRRGAPKVRTGCATCRYRRVKCDEAKPFCMRCIKFEVECEGYRQAQTTVQKRPLLPFQTTTAATVKPQLSATVTELPFANTTEHQYFTLFLTRTGYDIFPTFDSGQTRQRLLESCHFSPAIRHAIVALGALDKTAELAQSFESMSLSPIERDKAAASHHQNALKQYVKAVHHMALDASSKKQDLRTMLLTCLLTLAFESWIGSMDLAVQQVHTGVRLIQQWKESYSHDKDRYTRLSPAPYEVEDDLIQIFCRLAVQHTFFADGHSPELHMILGMEGPRFTRSMPGTFTSIYEAGKYYNGIIRRGVYLITTHSAYLGPSSPQDTALWRWALAEQEEIQGEVWRFNKALEPVLRTIGEGPEKHYALFIQLSMAIGYIGLSTHLATDEAIHDNYNPVYKRVVYLAKEVMKEIPTSNKTRPSNFCFDTRVIVPLWVVGLKCREPVIRREAISFLLANPRREGIWDSVFAGKVLEWAMAVEEEFMVDGKVPGWARIGGVRWSGAELGRKRAELVCMQRMREGDETLVRRTKTITW